LKRLLLTFGLLISVLLLSSCSDKNTVPQSNTGILPVEQPKTQGDLSIKDYFDFQENTRYIYEGQGNEYASYTTIVDYIKGNRVQLRSNNGGTETVKVLENNNGAITLLFLKGECYFREDFTQGPSVNNTGEVILKEPLIKGTTWTLADKRKRTITNVDFEVITPSGKYKTIEVTTESKGSKTADYYAPHMGLVKTVFNSNGFEVSSSLNKIERNLPLVQTVKFYYPSINDAKLYIMEKKLSFNTNDITKQVFEREFKTLPQGGLGKLIGPNVKIKSLYLNQDNALYVDFTKELVSEMNAGSGYESMILQSIVNTLGGYYGVEKVYLSVEGEPYSSGHIAMKKGEFFRVDFKDSVPTK
jgi:hypothetical protein